MQSLYFVQASLYWVSGDFSIIVTDVFIGIFALVIATFCSNWFA